MDHFLFIFVDPLPVLFASNAASLWVKSSSSRSSTTESISGRSSVDLSQLVDFLQQSRLGIGPTKNDDDDDDDDDDDIHIYIDMMIIIIIIIMLYIYIYIDTSTNSIYMLLLWPQETQPQCHEIRTFSPPLGTPWLSSTSWAISQRTLLFYPKKTWKKTHIGPKVHQ